MAPLLLSVLNLAVVVPAPLATLLYTSPAVAVRPYVRGTDTNSHVIVADPQFESSWHLVRLPYARTVLHELQFARILNIIC